MKSDAKKRNQITQEIMVHYPFTCSLMLQFEKLTIRVVSNSQTLIDYLREYFHSFIADTEDYSVLVRAIEAPDYHLPFTFTIKEPDPGKTKIKEEFIDFPDYRIVKKRLTGMYFLFGGDMNIAIGPCVDNPNQVINFINNRYIAWKLEQGCILGHAAAVTGDKKGLAIAGFSGMGKSTLALHILNRGLNFVSNDRLLITDVGKRIQMFGVAKQPRINPGTALNNHSLTTILSDAEKETFGKLNTSELWTLEQKYDVPIEKCFGLNRFQLYGWMDNLVILNWHIDGGETRIEEVLPSKRPDLIAAFMKSPGLFYNPLGDEKKPDLGISHYTDLIQKCTLLELSGGTDFEKAADICAQFLQ